MNRGGEQEGSSPPDVCRNQRAGWRLHASPSRLEAWDRQSPAGPSFYGRLGWQSMKFVESSHTQWRAYRPAGIPEATYALLRAGFFKPAGRSGSRR